MQHSQQQFTTYNDSKVLPCEKWHAEGCEDGSHARDSGHGLYPLRMQPLQGPDLRLPELPRKGHRGNINKKGVQEIDRGSAVVTTQSQVLVDFTLQCKEGLNLASARGRKPPGRRRAVLAGQDRRRPGTARGENHLRWSDL